MSKGRGGGRAPGWPTGGWASGGCAGGGSPPATPMCYQYVGNMNTWMAYGPFSLADATEASAEFDVWYDTEAYTAGPPAEGDRFWWVISVDGTNYSGEHISGSRGTS